MGRGRSAARDEREAEVVAAWQALPRDAHTRMWADPQMSRLYWALAHLGARVTAEAEVDTIIETSVARRARQDANRREDGDKWQAELARRQRL